MTKGQIITYSRLMELLKYEPLTGEFTWRNSGSGRPNDGVAGCANGKGKWLIKIDYKIYSAHRLAWFYMTGKWPYCLIDHIDRNPSNNKWSNLREADYKTNQFNTTFVKNSTGYKGVKKVTENCYRAQITIDGKLVNLGHFPTPKDASDAYNVIAMKYQGDFYVDTRVA